VLLGTQTLAEAAVFGALAILPGALSALLYWIVSRETMLNEVTSYSGWADFGLVSVLRTLLYFGPNSQKVLIFDFGLLDATKRLFVFGYAAVTLLLPLFRRDRLIHALILIPVLFYGLYGGVSAQYLDWVI